MRKRKLLLAAGTCLATLALTVSSASAEPTPEPDPGASIAVPIPIPGNCPKNFWAMDLITGQKLGALLPGSFIQPATENNALGQVVVQLDLKPTVPITCKQANIVVEYEGTPSNWTVDIGDSSTNDGYAGGVPGTTRACAEVQVLGNTVSAYKDCLPIGPLPGALPLPLLPNPNPLSLKDGALKFVVKDQYLSVGQPFATPAAADLPHSFHVPDTIGPLPDGSKIYAAFNRVIFGPGARVGTGARRIMITLQ
ncbi:MAG: hypothetical protein ACRDRU_15745 [Pseudonocardiaceae bacterium]